MQTPCLKPAFVLHAGRRWFAAERTRQGNLLTGILLVLLVYGHFIFLVARQTYFIAATGIMPCFGSYAGKRNKTDGAILRRRQRSEQVDILELLLELLHQRIEPLTDALRRQLLWLARLHLFALLTHDET